MKILKYYVTFTTPSKKIRQKLGTINPKIYEINFRLWIKNFGEQAKISGIPTNYFRTLAEKGISFFWLMGMWKTSDENIIKECCFESGLISAYNKALKDWKEEDVIGSPFSISSYEVNPDYGSWEDLKKFKADLNKEGLKLILDFIPNHLSGGTKLIQTNPEIFLQADEEIFKNDPHTFFKSDLQPDKIFAHGRDPLFPAWTDTIQLNLFNENAREFLTNTLLKLTEVCDGVRCDMAMLQLNNVFKNTWLGVINKHDIHKPTEEFWQYAIRKVKNKNKEFIFIAEAYWDLEWQLQQLGFDYTYDKRLLDRLSSHDLTGVRNHLHADLSFQLKSVRFIENHDEKRAIEKFGKQASMAAAILISSVPGMKLYYDGQFEGKKIKLPVQLGREPKEKESERIKEFYDKILKITKDRIFIDGEFLQLKAFPVSPDNHSYENIFVFLWRLENNYRLTIINFSENTSQCRVKFDPSNTNPEIELVDLLDNQKYKRSVSDIITQGLYVELRSYGSHIFAFNPK